LFPLGETIVKLSGTGAGSDLATVLALSAAFLNALFGALQKGRHDPWLSRGAIDLCTGLIALPAALFLVPLPEPHLWPILALVWVVHAAYKLGQAGTYTYGAYTVVYPVVRGTAPLFTVIGAGILFGERFTPTQWLGVALLVAGILGLAAYNLRHVTVGREHLPRALALAVLTGGLVTLYTTVDAWGIRATADPFTFLAWLFVIDGLGSVILAAAVVRWRRMPLPPLPGPLLLRGIIGAVVGILSYGSFILATRLDNVGEAAVLRETSVVFAAAIGWLLLGERTGPRRVALMVTIAAGAIVVERGG
jgi:drug/metabolite transporter (DMT)-like permease